MPFVLCFGCLAINSRRQAGYLMLSLAGAIVIILVAYLIIYGSWHNFYSEFMAAMVLSTDATAADHSTGNLLKEYLHTLKDFIWHLKSLLMPAMVILLIDLIENKKQSIYRYSKYILWCMFALSVVYVLRRNINFGGHLSWDLSVMLIAMTLYVCCLMSALAVYHHERKSFVWFLLPIFCSLPAAAGADSGLAYMAAPLFSLLPFLLLGTAQSYRSFSETDSMLAVAFTGAMIVFVYLYMRSSLQPIAVVLFVLAYITLWAAGFRGKSHIAVYQETTSANRRWLAVSLYILILLFALSGKYMQYGDERPIAECRYAFNHPQLAGIRSAKQTTEWCETVMNDYRHLKEQGYEVVFYGYMSNLFAYLAGEGKIQGVDFTFKTNARNTEAFLSAIVSRSVVMFCPLIQGSRSLCHIDSYQASMTI